MPTFSVLMPNFNYRHYLPFSLGSVLSQTFTDFEVIISDDQSTDGSWEWITSQIHDPRVSWHRLERNSGVSAAINLALRHATGEYIVVLDPDDLYHPQFLQRQHEVLTANPEIDICGTWVAEIDIDGEPSTKRGLHNWFNGDFDLNDPAIWVWQNRLAHGCAVIRKTAHDVIGEFDEELPITVDWNFWIRCLAAGRRFHLIHEELFLSRIHGSNMTHSRPVKMVRSYAKTSAEHFHPYLLATGRQDLVGENMRGFMTHSVMNETDLATAAEIMTILAGDPVEGRALALGTRSLAMQQSASRIHVGQGEDDAYLNLNDIRAAELARALFYLRRAEAAERQLGLVVRERDELASQARAAQLSLDRLRGTLPIRAATYVNRRRLQLQQRRADRRSAAPDPIPASPPPAVSVVLVASNSGPVLQRAIDSVLHQSMPDWELVLCDDGSDDVETLAIIEGVRGPRIRTIRLENSGLRSARNSAAAHATGDVLVFLHAHDELEETYFEKALLLLARFPDIDIVCPAVRVMPAPGEAAIASEFEEHRLAYQNSVPTSSAMRRRVWDAVGGIPSGADDGLEEWGFWRSAAAKGFRGWSFDEALIRHTPVEDGRSGASGDALRIKQLNPYIGERGVDGREDPAALRGELAHRVFHVPPSVKQPLVVFVPWLLKGGGAPAFLRSTLLSLSSEFEIFIIATNQMAQGHASAVNDFLDVTPYVYDLPALVGPDATEDMVASLLYRLEKPHILLVGSPWAYANIAKIRSMSRGRGRLVDVQFNHLGHLPKLLEISPHVDMVLAAHNRLRSLLVDYFAIPRPVRVLYIAPPPMAHEPRADVLEDRPRDRLRIGWLGRNSPEKRPDLVATIATALPEADFVLAGSRLDELPEQPSNVHLEGWVADAVDFLAGLDFILNTSDIEGISVTAMEALQLGIPVLTRDVGGMAELVRDGENGLVYSESAVHELARRLRDPGFVERIRANAERERLPEVFHHESMVQTVRAALLGT